MENIIIVDEHDKQIGVGEKLEVHKKGMPHRAFSIFIVNRKGEMLLQKRSSIKYHSAGLWTNTCCSHPRDGEMLSLAVHRRLEEEMGFDTQLTEISQIKYKIKFENGLIENEFLHIFLGTFNGDPVVNEHEADDHKWISYSSIESDVLANPTTYTYWFKKTLPIVLKHLSSPK